MLESPSAASLYFPESLWQPEISFLSKVVLVLKKGWNHRAPNLGCRGLSYLGDLMFHQKTLQEMVCISGHIVVMRLLITSCPQLHPCSSFCISQPMKNIEVGLPMFLLLFSYSYPTFSPLLSCTPSIPTPTVNLPYCPCPCVLYSCSFACPFPSLSPSLTPLVPANFFFIFKSLLLFCFLGSFVD